MVEDVEISTSISLWKRSKDGSHVGRNQVTETKRSSLSPRNIKTSNLKK